MAFTDLGSLGATGSTANDQVSLILTTTAAVAVGELVVIVVAVDNPQSGGDAGVSGVTNSGTANTWLKAIQVCNAVAAQGGASCSLWYTVATAAMASGATITATFGSATSSDASGMTARHFSVAAGSAVVIEGTPGTLLHNTALDPGSLNVTTANIECLRVRGCAAQVGNNTNLTPTASWTFWANGNSATSGTTAEMCARAEHRIVTGTSAASDPTYVSAINANVYVAFKELPAATGTLAATEGNVYELLLHFDGADASTTITDSGGKSQTVTAHGAAEIDTAQSVFVGQALMLTSADDYVSADTGDYAFGTGDFTIDFQARLSSASAAQVFYEGGPGGFKIFYDGAALKFTSAAGTITGSGLSANTNYHIAATRAAGSTRLWRDGVQQGSTLTDATSYTATTGYPRIGASGLDAATTAWVAAVGSGNVSSSRRTLIDNLIVGLKADGIWSRLDRLWIFAAENATSALTDLKGLATATPVNSPSFSADDGYTGNGSTSYIDTNFDPSSGLRFYTANTASFGIWDITTTPAAGAVQAGAVAFGIYTIDLTMQYTDANSYWRITGGGGPTITYPGAGFFACNRSAGSGAGCIQLYRNGSSIATDSTSASVIQSVNVYVLARNSAGTPAAHTTDQIAACYFGDTFNSTEHANLYARLRTYMTAVGVP